MPSLLYSNWCQVRRSDIAVTRSLHLVAEMPGRREAKHSEIVSTIDSHYEDPTFLADRVQRLGMTKAASVLAELMPQDKKARSGHLGEILATEIVAEVLPTFEVPIKRLRCTDGRNLALRGDDIIGIEVRPNRVRFLKGESKSRSALTPIVLKEARYALAANNGRPSQFSMGYMMRRLMETGNKSLALVFESYLVDKSIKEEDLAHMVFTFTGNNVETALRSDLMSCQTSYEQHSVNLRIADHGDFIESAYQR